MSMNSIPTIALGTLLVLSGTIATSACSQSGTSQTIQGAHAGMSGQMMHGGGKMGRAQPAPAATTGLSPDLAEGARIYVGSCASCHGTDGRGAVPGAPDFTIPGGVLDQTDTLLEQRITQGYSTPNVPLAMPPKGGNPGLSAIEIRQVLRYMHHAFGGRAAPGAGSTQR